MEDDVLESSETPLPKLGRGRSKKSEKPIFATQLIEEEEKLELPVIEEEPSQKKGRRGR